MEKQTRRPPRAAVDLVGAKLSLVVLGSALDKAEFINRHHIAAFGASTQMRFAEARRFDGHGVALQQARYAALTLFSFLCLEAGRAGGRIVLVVIFRLGVGRDEAFVVAENRFAGSLTDQVLRPNRDFAAAAGSIDHVGG